MLLSNKAWCLFASELIGPLFSITSSPVAVDVLILEKVLQNVQQLPLRKRGGSESVLRRARVRLKADQLRQGLG